MRAVVHERPKGVEGMLLICPMVVADDEWRDVPPSLVFRRDSALEVGLEVEEREFLDLFLMSQSEGNWERFRDERLVGLKGGDSEFKSKIRDRVETYAFSFDVDELVTPFKKSSLIFTGRQDCLVGYRDRWKLVDNFPRASFYVLDKAGHGLQIDQAELSYALVN